MVLRSIIHYDYRFYVIKAHLEIGARSKAIDESLGLEAIATDRSLPINVSFRCKRPPNPAGFVAVLCSYYPC